MHSKYVIVFLTIVFQFVRNADISSASLTPLIERAIKENDHTYREFLIILQRNRRYTESIREKQRLLNIANNNVDTSPIISKNNVDIPPIISKNNVDPIMKNFVESDVTALSNQSFKFYAMLIFSMIFIFLIALHKARHIYIRQNHTSKHLIYLNSNFLLVSLFLIFDAYCKSNKNEINSTWLFIVCIAFSISLGTTIGHSLNEYVFEIMMPHTFNVIIVNILALIYLLASTLIRIFINFEILNVCDKVEGGIKSIFIKIFAFEEYLWGENLYFKFLILIYCVVSIILYLLCKYIYKRIYRNRYKSAFF